MTSGIYKLTFRNGDTYIGKSNNIERRWSEHWDKMKRGKAAANMQAAFRRSGEPMGEIMCKCHEDHISLMETYYIRQLRPNLNAAATVAYDNWTEDMLRRNLHLLGNSTCELISMLAKTQKAMNDFEKCAKDALEYTEILEKKRKDENIAAAGKKLVEELIREKNFLDTENQALTKRIQYLELPWWKRWFR